MAYETIIGLEIHVQLATKSKMFCGCDNDSQESEPNTHVCPICMGHPGTLPLVNRQAVEWGVMAALALGCSMPELAKFDRKHYYYPDLPKGYQISQYDMPIAESGRMDMPGTADEASAARPISIRINRLHLEEDAAKLTHHEGGGSLVDFNRAGTPLAEIVTEPDFRSPQQTKAFLQELRLLMRHLGVSNADMEKGQLRCDANISLRPEGEDNLHPKTEIKNLTSFKAVEKALLFEQERIGKLFDAGNPPAFSSTRGWNDTKQMTEEQRDKEDSADYRYFPEPDIPPLVFHTGAPGKAPKDAIDVPAIVATTPQAPWKLRQRFMDEYGFALKDASVLTEDKRVATYTEQVISELREWIGTNHQDEGSEEELWEAARPKVMKMVNGWITTRLFKLMKESRQEIQDIQITAENMAELISLVYARKLNNTTGLQVLEEMFRTGIDPSTVIQEKGLESISDEKGLADIVQRVIAANPDPVAEYQAGKEPVIKFLVGLVMRESKGQADARGAEEELKKQLAS